MNFRKNTKPRSQEKKRKKDIVLQNLYNFFEGREKVLDAFESKIFSIKSKRAGILNPNHSKLKVITPKQMLQRLPIALAQVKAGNNSESLLNEIRQIVYSLYQSKQVTKNSRSPKPHILTLKLTNKLDLRIGKKVIALSNLSIYYTWKNIKSSYNNNKFKISAPTWNDEFKLPDGSYSVSDIQDYFEYILKKHGENIYKPSVQIYVNKIENRVTFKIKDGYTLELLTPETMKLLGSSKNKITKDKNGENVPHLEITEVILVHYNIVNNDYQQDSRVLYTFVPNKPFW